MAGTRYSRTGVVTAALLAALLAACAGDAAPSDEAGGTGADATPVATSSGAPATTRAQSAPDPGYSIESLPVIVEYGHTLKINDRGRIIGWGRVADQEGGFVWDPQSGLENLGRLEPRSINAEGLVGGEDMANEDSWQAFLWEPDTGVRDMGTPRGWPKFTLMEVNDAGQFAGVAERGDVDDIEPTEVYLWDPSTGWTGFGRDSGVEDLNNPGQVLITMGDGPAGAYEHHMFLWTPGASAKDLGVGYGGMLNDSGQAVLSGALGGQIHLWDPVTETRTDVTVGQAHRLNDGGRSSARRAQAGSTTPSCGTPRTESRTWAPCQGPIGRRRAE